MCIYPATWLGASSKKTNKRNLNVYNTCIRVYTQTLQQRGSALPAKRQGQETHGHSGGCGPCQVWYGFCRPYEAHGSLLPSVCVCVWERECVCEWCGFIRPNEAQGSLPQRVCVCVCVCVFVCACERSSVWHGFVRRMQRMGPSFHVCVCDVYVCVCVCDVWVSVCVRVAWCVCSCVRVCMT